MPKKIPPYIVDNDLRLRLAIISKAQDALVKEHVRLAKKAKDKTITPEEQKNRQEIVKGVNDLEKLWRKLVPKLPDIIPWPDEE